MDDCGVCAKLAEWAKVADVESPRAGTGALAIHKSDLLNRLIRGDERGPSRTPCPVHKGRWQGCDFGWPGQMWYHVDGSAPTPVEVNPRLQEYWDAGCRCATHKGSACTTGWNPDEYCCKEEE